MSEEINLGNLSVNFSEREYKKLENKSQEKLRAFLKFLDKEAFKDYKIKDIESGLNHFKITLHYNDPQKVPLKFRQNIQKRDKRCTLQTESDEDVIFLPYPKKRTCKETFCDWKLILLLIIILYIIYKMKTTPLLLNRFYGNIEKGLTLIKK